MKIKDINIVNFKGYQDYTVVFMGNSLLLSVTIQR